MSKAPSFGDNVRIVATPLTAAHGLAGAAGEVRGETTPSVTGIEVIGVLTGDYAVHVYLPDRDEGFWLAPDLVEFVDHAPGSTMSLDLPGGRKTWRRTADGEWVEEANATIAPTTPRRRWWFPWSRRP